jgi:hypothetical protein
MKIEASGQLQHHFWGDYSATIGLAFDSEIECELALPFLKKMTEDVGTFRNACGGISDSIGWVSKGKAAAIVVSDDPLERTLTALKTLGAGDDISSCRTSIDYGPMFHISMEVEDPNQVTMKL